ncbi:helix-turn-helix domain-containing protein [Kaarinaea lacus]
MKHGVHPQVAGQPAVPFTRFGGLLPFIKFFNDIGAPTERYLREAKIPVSYMESPNAAVPLNSAYRFAEKAAYAEGVRNLGLIVGQNTSLDDIGPYGHYIQQSNTIYEYLQKGIQLIEKHSNGMKFWLSTDNDELRFNTCVLGNSDYGRAQADMQALIITINTLRKMTDNQWCPRGLNLARMHTEELPAIEALADTRITIDGEFSSFVLPRAMLSKPFRRPSKIPQSANVIEKQLQPPLPIDFLIAMQQIVEMLLLQGISKVELAAEAAGLTVRTLQRRLTEAGVSYTQLVNTTRVDIAACWLEARELSVTTIAAMLGYTDASNFTRAFRRQTGVSPQAYREANTTH